MARLSYAAQTLAGQVMHDLGIWAAQNNTPPGSREANRFATARGAEQNMSGAEIIDVAVTALADWRATRKLERLGPGATFTSAYPKGQAPEDCIGVRVVLELKSRRGRGRKSMGTASVLVNAKPGETGADAIFRAIDAWNARQIRTPRGSDQNTRATDGNVVQLSEGGWTHAQVSTC